MYSARDIRNLESQLKKRALGGYDADSVKTQLGALAQQWEQMEEARRAAEDRVRELEDKLKHYEKVELALQEALETARDTARRTEESADRKARLIVEEAELRGQRIIQEAEQERYGLRQDLHHLTNRQTEVAARLRSFLMSELEMLAQFQGEDPIGFIKLVAPERSVEERTLPGPSPALAESLSVREDEDVDSPEEQHADDSLAESQESAQDAHADHTDVGDIHEEERHADAVAPEEAGPDATVEPPTNDAAAESRTDDAEESLSSSEAAWTAPISPPPTSASFPPSDLSDEDLTDEERADVGSDDEVEGTAHEPMPKPAPPRSPWPDVDASRARTMVWPPVPKPPEEDAPRVPVEPGASAAEASEPQNAPVTPDPPSTAPTWTSPSGLTASPDAEPPPAADTPGGWSLRSLVTGDDTSEAAKDEHREAVRRIMEDMD